MRLTILAFFLLFFVVISSQAEAVITNSQRVVFSADIVSSACHVDVDADRRGNNQLTFGTLHKSKSMQVSPREFTVHLYESGATVAGCSAFRAGQIATLQFGNAGQLDPRGVVTHGAGDGIYIDVRAIDPQANFRGSITQEHNFVSYPVDFAAKGQFRFRAQPIVSEAIRAGEYNGALSFVVTYQ